MSADGSVTLFVNMDASDADRELARLKQKILRLEEDLTVKRNRKNVLAAQLEEAERKFYELDKRAMHGDTAAAAQLEPLAAEIEKIQSAVEKQNEALKNTQLELDGVRIRYGDVAREAQQIADDDAMADARDRAHGLADTLEQTATSAQEAGSELSESFGTRLTNALQKVWRFAQKAGSALLNLFRQSNRTSGGGLKNILRYALGVRSLLALVNRLRTALVSGFQNLAQFSDKTNAAISSVRSALTQLKNSLATAFAPILTVVAPILTKFINMLSAAADSVARFAAMLTGKTSYVRAKRVQEDYAASLRGTGAAAKEAARELAGFDEINRLAAQDIAGGGGGTAVGDMFETVDIEPLKFDSWGEAFSTFLNNLLENGIPKLKSALSRLATWINTFAGNLYEAFTFPGVVDKVAALGVEIASALNGFVNDIDWATIGAALGAGLELAITFLFNFVYTFDWKKLGESIATMLNNMIKQIDWKQVGALLWAKFKIAIELLAGFISNTDVEALADAATDLIVGFLNSMEETIESVNWEEIGDKLAQVLRNINWEKVGNAFFSALGAALSGLGSFIVGLFRDAWNDGLNEITKGEANLRKSLGIRNKGGGGSGTSGKLGSSVSRQSAAFGIAAQSVVLPRLASGAVIPPNREFMAVLGDQRSGNNIEAPEALIRKIVREETGGSARLEALLQTLIEVTREGKVIQVNERELGRVTSRAQANAMRASGRAVLSY
nr:MAG TPA: minor tail protein [Caudoviricetes sp.]